jgi:hypothetical protein
MDQVTILNPRKEDGENGLQWVSDFELQDSQAQTVAEVKVIAKTARRADELYQAIIAEKAVLASGQNPLNNYDGVFILIGANDEYQTIGDQGIERFKQNLNKILGEAVFAMKNHDASRVTVLGIPSWGKSPIARNPEAHLYRINKYCLEASTIESVSQEIAQYNLAAKSVVDSYNQQNQSAITFVPAIERLSIEYGVYPLMTQDDGLHYRWEMTQKWNDAIFSTVPFLQNTAPTVSDVNDSIHSLSMN